MSDLHDEIEKHPAIHELRTDVAKLKEGQDRLTGEVSRVVSVVESMESSMEKIQADLALTATREDVRALGAHMDKSINELLRDAINSFPGKYAVWLTAILVGMAIIDHLQHHGWHF